MFLIYIKVLFKIVSKGLNIINILEKIPLFSELNKSELERLENISTLQEYKKEEPFITKGESLTSLMILVDGIVSVYKEDSKGNEIVMGYFHRYEMLIEPPTLMHEPSFSSGKFKSNGAIVKVNLEVFEKEFMILPSISKGIINSLLKKIKLLQQNIHLSINSTAKEKIIHFYKNNHSLSIDLKKYEIASLLGISAETFSRNIKILIEEKKLISSASRYRWLGEKM